MPHWVLVNNESRQRKKGTGVGGCIHQHVLGSQISQGTQVSGFKDVEKGIKNIRGVGFLEDSGRCYQHKDTLKHRHTHTSPGSSWSCSATVTANLNPSLTITAVSTDWTEVVLADVMLADNIPTHTRGNMVFPMLFILSLTKEHHTVQVGSFFSRNLPLWIVYDLFWATLEGGNRKTVIELPTKLIWQLLSHHAGCLCFYCIFSYRDECL